MKKRNNKIFYEKNNSKGITLIALVITIVILIILAVITVNAVFGENGLLNQANKGAEEYSKSDVKERVTLLIGEYVIEKATGEEDNFANFLRKNLQVGVVQNEDGTYSFAIDEWQVITTENEVISVEKLNINTDKTYASVASMKSDTSLTDGQLVQTEGYWDKQYGGGAYYDIASSTSLTVDDTKCIQLDNGLYAELHPINDTVTVNQFGAYGDGEHDDAGAIQLALNAGYGNVSFESERYKFGKTITLSTSNVSVIGNSATLFWNEDVEVPWEQFQILGTQQQHVENIQIQYLHFENGNITNSTTSSEQFLARNCDNITISNCKFNVLPIEGNNTRKITNMWFNTEWSNVLIEDNEFINLTNSGLGCNICLSDQTNNVNFVSQNAIIRNNYMEKSCHDETIAIWDGTIQNVLIQRNEFNIKEKNLEEPSYMNFTLGNRDGIVKDIKFIENQVSCESTGTLITCNGAIESENILIENNTIEWNKLGDISYESLISSGEYNYTKNLNVINNKIKYTSDSEIYLRQLFDSNIYVNENEIEVNGKLFCISNIDNASEGCAFYGNNITINSDIQYLYAGYEFCDNNVVINGEIGTLESSNSKSLFYYYNEELMKNVKILNNQITLNQNEVWNEYIANVLFLLNTRINNYNIDLSNNELIADLQANVQNIVRLNGIKDTTTQKIHLKDNRFGNFKRIGFYDNLVQHIVVWNEKEISTNTILE